MNQNNSSPGKHSVRVKFLGAAGQVTPSSTLLSFDVGANICQVLIDVGTAIREETQDGKNARAIRVPLDPVDVIILTHAHTDHCGDLPAVVQKHPDAKVFAPEGTKPVLCEMIDEAHRRQIDRDILSELDTWKREGIRIVELIEEQEEKLAKGIKRGKNGQRKAVTVSNERLTQTRTGIEDRLADAENLMWDFLGIKRNSTIELFEYLERDISSPERHYVSSADFREAVDKEYSRRLDDLSRQGIITKRDVSIAKSKITEISLKTNHSVLRVLGRKKSKRSVVVKMQNSGHMHTVPAAQVLIKVPVNGGNTVNVLFSGDRGNSQLNFPYAQADDEGLKDSADVLVLEATYGDRIHPDREKELQKLEKFIIDAIQKGEDIIIPVISLDRPVVVMYEFITRLVDTGIISKNDFEAYYFGQMISRLLSKAPNHDMINKIRPYWSELSHEEIKSFCSKKSKKSRFVPTGGGFLPKKGSPAGALLEYALLQDKLSIISANYYGGPGSNMDNLLNGREFQLTKEGGIHAPLKDGQKGFSSGAFSGHEDGPGLVEYARRVVKLGGTIFLNHGSEESRERLKSLLSRDRTIIQKNVTIIAPKPDKFYFPKKVKTRK